MTRYHKTPIITYQTEMNLSDEISCDRRNCPSFAFVKIDSASSLDTWNVGFLKNKVESKFHRCYSRNQSSGLNISGSLSEKIGRHKFEVTYASLKPCTS